MPYATEWPSLRSATGRVDIHSLAAFFAKETKVMGDYFEFGVGMARSTVAAIRAEQMYQRDGSLFHLFDTFAGLPEIVGKDADFGQFKRGDFAYSLDSVQAFLRQHDALCEDRLRFFPGDFRESLGKAPISFEDRKAAIVTLTATSMNLRCSPCGL